MNGDGYIQANPGDWSWDGNPGGVKDYSEVLQENHYYPFGMSMEGQWRMPDLVQKTNRYQFNGIERHGDMNVDLDLAVFRSYDAAMARWLHVDPLAEERSWVSPYNFVQNNPVSRLDPTGALDDWVQTEGGQMVYDNRVINQEDATAIYGSGATYRPVGYSYKASDGSSVELGDYGFFKQDGQTKYSPDLAQSSLAFTNPDQAMADAQCQIAGVKDEYMISAGVVGYISTDVSIPEPTDAAWAKWATYAVAGGLSAYYVVKMKGEIEGIMRRAGGPQGVQYSLRATGTRAYTCFTCGTGTMNLSLGDVWKYGETINPAGRYSQGKLNGLGLMQVNEFYGNQVQIKVMEKTKIYEYFSQHGHLPPGNKIFR